MAIVALRSARVVRPARPGPPAFTLRRVDGGTHEIRFAGTSATVTVRYGRRRARRFAALYSRLFLAPRAPLARARLSGPERLDLIEVLTAVL